MKQVEDKNKEQGTTLVQAQVEQNNKIFSQQSNQRNSSVSSPFKQRT